jgi:putative ABC transport system permease protein
MGNGQWAMANLFRAGENGRRVETSSVRASLTRTTGGQAMNSFWRDLRYGLRVFWQQPGFTLIVVLTLALGIGANSAIFSVINGVLLKPLPFPEPEQVVKLWESKQAGWQGSVSVPNLKDWREQNTVFTKIAAFQYANYGLQAQDAPERVRAATVSPEFFDVLGVPPLVGRTIQAGEDQPGQHRVAVLSHQLWQTKFAGDPKIVGQPIQLGGEAFTVIGVMPARLRYPSRLTDLWVPLVIPASQQAARGSHFLLCVARLKPGVALAQAQEEMSVIARRIEQQHPNEQTGRGVLVIQAQEEIVRSVRPALLMLLAAVGFVLLIACVNVANLLLARSAGRRREVAIRMALGAGRGRLIRQLLTESVLLALLGGILGIVFAYWGVGVLVSWAGTILPRASEVALDGRVVGFTAALALLTGVLFGLAPAWQSTKTDLQTDLKEGGAKGGSARGHWVRSLLVVGEIAAALVLLVGALLLIKSFAQLQQTATGLNPEQVLTMGLSLPESKYATTEAINNFHTRTLERVAALPGVQSVGLISKLPVQDYGYNGSVEIEGQAPPPKGQEVYVEFRAVSPDYFRTFGIPLLAGRGIEPHDQPESARVVVVNQTFARTLVNDQQAVGKTITKNNTKFQIVGVVGDVRQSGLRQPTRPEMYWPYTQVPDDGLRSSVSLVVRATSDPAALTAAVRQAVLSVDPAQPVHNVKTMETVVAESIADHRLNTLLLGVFAALALLLAVIGVYSVISYQVAQNTRERGIRIALGAQALDVLRLVVGQGMVLTVAGIGAGVVAAFALTRLMASLLIGVVASDPLTYVWAALLLGVVALVACCLPARRAMRVDPLVALRYE